MHLDGGLAPDGTRVMSAQAVAAMQRREVDVPDKWTVSADGWGLGWTLYDRDGIAGPRRARKPPAGRDRAAAVMSLARTLAFLTGAMRLRLSSGMSRR